MCPDCGELAAHPICKLFGHKIIRGSTSGFKPSIMKNVYRKTKFCTRCDKMVKLVDKVVSDYDISEGIELDSSGVCGQCSQRKKCKVLQSIYSVYAKCPTRKFKPTKECLEHCKKMGDTIIG